MEKLKILITGKNQGLLEEIFSEVSREHSIMSASFSQSDITNHLEMLKPDLFIICLQAETMEDIIALDNVSKVIKKMDIPTFIAGSQEDCDYYNDNLSVRATKSFPMPVSIDDLKSQINTLKAADELNVADFLDKDGHVNFTKVNNYEFVQNTKNADPFTKRRVMVIDDSPIMLRLIKEQLAWKYDVAIAISGKIAYKYLEENTVSLILLDYDMPGESGTEVFKKLRLNPKTATVPIIFLTGINDKDLISRALVLNPQGYLLKPVDKEKLLSTVESFIG